jgi:aminoglycoside phosphotransferase (APT) family kinase protein
VRRLLRRIRRQSPGFTPGTLRRAASAAGFATARLYAPFPFTHKFHQIVDLERTDMNVCANPYRIRGRTLRWLVRVWDALNADGTLERRLYPYLPAVSAVLSGTHDRRPFAERVLAHIGMGDQPLARYYVRGHGVTVLVAGTPGAGGRIVRLPIDLIAEESCGRHHRALRGIVADLRVPAAMRALFPAPLGEGKLSGHAYFVESALPGDTGRLFYARPVRRYERAIASGAGVLSALRRATERPVTIDDDEFERLCGRWLSELEHCVDAERRPVLDRVGHVLRHALIGRTVPLGWYHGDYDFANLLYGPRDEVSGIIDFDLFDPRGLPLVDHMVLLARRPVRHGKVDFGALFLNSILPRAFPPFEGSLMEREIAAVGADDDLYRALALFAWLDHVRLRRRSWLVRSPRWRRDNVDVVLDGLRGRL